MNIKDALSRAVSGRIEALTLTNLANASDAVSQHVSELKLLEAAWASEHSLLTTAEQKLDEVEVEIKLLKGYATTTRLE